MPMNRSVSGRAGVDQAAVETGVEPIPAPSTIAIRVAMVPTTIEARAPGWSASTRHSPGRRSRTRPNRTPDRGHARGSVLGIGVREQPGKAAISTKAVISRIEARRSSWI